MYLFFITNGSAVIVSYLNTIQYGRVKMVFSLTVEARFHVDPLTGAFYRRLPKDPNKILLISKPYVVPVQHRRFLQIDGDFLQAYVMDHEGAESNEVDAAFFLERIPSWDHVKQYFIENNIDWIHDWSIMEHIAFVNALKWLAENPGYYVKWSA